MKKLAQAKTKILRGAFLAFLIMSMSAMPTVQAADVNIYQDGDGIDDILADQDLIFEAE